MCVWINGLSTCLGSSVSSFCSCSWVSANCRIRVEYRVQLYIRCPPQRHVAHQDPSIDFLLTSPHVSSHTLTSLHIPSHTRRCASDNSTMVYSSCGFCGLSLVLHSICYVYTLCGHAYAMVSTFFNPFREPALIGLQPETIVGTSARCTLKGLSDDPFQIPCDSPRCKFSHAHPTSCPDCKRTCWQ